MVSIVSKIKNEDYYVQMMQARFYSTALAKHPKETIELLNKYGYVVGYAFKVKLSNGEETYLKK